MHKLHEWTQDGVQWYCLAYDHGPFCRQCKTIPLGPEGGVVRMLLTEIEQRDEWIQTTLDSATRSGVGLCQAKPDHGGPHTERPECLYWMELAKEHH